MSLSRLCLIGLLCLVAFGLAAYVVAPGITASGRAQTTLSLQTEAYIVTGKPTISVAKLDQILCETYNGVRPKACHSGQDLYNLGIEYGIDPIFALAFFRQESTYGTSPLAQRTLNLGNMRCAGYATCYEGFRVYADLAEGYNDWYRLIAHGYVNGEVSSQCPCKDV
ncbi:glucosaminidase domain-containing protein [Ktedonospora formicarum]|uniref:Uncharacterized protein n=1 Tax=Ktedonospora formicarum TaxID=2778364 RepID=A0A8J3I5Z4_9CHLR|nr:glucosaminidase domain-containing protein [Ktedonospora formicarum]GHO50957.1 hypothetical protein KSX_91200 [Ktedonospora formicarum]